MGIQISKESLDYSRLMIHLKYFVLRMMNDSDEVENKFDGFLINEENEEYKRISKCLDAIDNFINKELNVNLSKSERFYLMIHIIRVVNIN